MNAALAEIKSAVDKLGGQINAPQDLLPTYGYTLDGAHPHIEAGGAEELFYVIVERGQELKRELAFDMKDLLYKIFADVTFSMAVGYEVKHRNQNEDARRQLFTKQEKLLSALYPEWGERRKTEHAMILQSYPFTDKV